MDPKIVTISNQKGGVAKSTSALTIATAFHLMEQKVLIIDLDAQGNLTHTLKAGKAPYSIIDVLTKKVNINDAVFHTNTCDILCSSRNLGSADLQIIQTGKEYRLKEEISNLRVKPDIIIIDTPPALGILTINALTASDEIIIPAQADIYSMQGIEQVYESVQAVRQYCNPKLRILGILLTRYNPQTILSREILQQLEKAAPQFGTKVFKTKIRECIAIKEAQAKQMDIFAYDSDSNGCIDYIKFMKEYLGVKDE